MYCCGPHYSGITEAVLLTSFHSCPHISSRYKSSVSQMADRLQGSCRIYPVSPRKLVVEQEIRSMILVQVLYLPRKYNKIVFPDLSLHQLQVVRVGPAWTLLLWLEEAIKLQTLASSYQKSLMVHRSGSEHKAWAGSFFFSLNLEKKKKKFGLKNKQTKVFF